MTTTRNLGLIAVVIVSATLPTQALAQPNGFYDNFNRSTLDGGPTTYTTTNTSTGTASVVSSSFLQLNSGSTSATSGRVWSTASTSAIGAGYNPTLSQNNRLDWTFNFRNSSLSENQGGFANGRYAMATVLASNSAALTASTTEGYAVVFGNNSSLDRVELVRFSGGLSPTGTITNIISTDQGARLSNVNNFASVGVRMEMINGEATWSLYLRDDGTTAWADPNSGTLSQLGTATIDNTYTKSTLTNFGFFWNHGNTGNLSASFDNYGVNVTNVTPTPEPAVTLAISSLGLVALAGIRRVRRRKLQTS
jgi:trimeric autotransporter adhesin